MDTKGIEPLLAGLQPVALPSELSVLNKLTYKVTKTTFHNLISFLYLFYISTLVASLT